MDTVSKEESFAYDEPSPEPPALIESSLDFGHVLQGSSKTLQQVIANTTRKPMIWLADASDARWLTLEPDHGVLQPGEQQSIRMTANTRFLQVGEHTVTLTFSSEGDERSMSSNLIGKISVGNPENGPQRDPPLPPLALQAGLNFGGLTPQSTRTLMLQISNPDPREVQWEIQIGQGSSGAGVRKRLAYGDKLSESSSIQEPFNIVASNGVKVSQKKDSLSPGESTRVYVTVNAAQLDENFSYMTDLTLTSSVDNVSTSVTVPIICYVSLIMDDDGGPKPPPSIPPHIKLAIPSGQNSGTASLSFENNNDGGIPGDSSGTVDWNVVSDAPWLDLKALSGTFNPGQTATVTLTAHRAGLAKSYHTTDMHLTLNWHPANKHDTELIIPVTVEIQ